MQIIEMVISNVIEIVVSNDAQVVVSNVQLYKHSHNQITEIIVTLLEKCRKVIWG